jgi:hypothetical protein
MDITLGRAISNKKDVEGDSWPRNCTVEELHASAPAA